MSRQLILVAVCLSAAVATAVFGGPLGWKSVAEKAPTILAVFVAAVFVRLARGVPTFPFEKIPQSSAKLVLEAVDHLQNVYRLSFASFIFALVASVLYAEQVEHIVSPLGKSVALGLLSFFLFWSVAVAYLIYRTDIAVLRAQSQALHTVVDQIASDAASTTLETVRKNLDVGTTN